MPLLLRKSKNNKYLMNNFFILINESTDIAMAQVWAVVVWYFDEEKQDLLERLFTRQLRLNVEMFKIYSAASNLLIDKSIHFKNIIGFGIDNCSKMIGFKSGFQKIVEMFAPSIFILGCVHTNHSPASTIPFACPSRMQIYH